MPCHDYGRDYESCLRETQQENLALQARCDLLAQMLCSVMGTLDQLGEVSMPDIPKDVCDWWNEHKEKDRARISAEKARLDVELKRMVNVQESALREIQKISAEIEARMAELKRLGR